MVWVFLFYLSSILAFFSSASASKMFFSSRSGNWVIQWTKDVTNTSLGNVSSKSLFFNVSEGDGRRFRGYRRALCSRTMFRKPIQNANCSHTVAVY